MAIRNGYIGNMPPPSSGGWQVGGNTIPATSAAFGTESNTVIDVLVNGDTLAVFRDGNMDLNGNEISGVSTIVGVGDLSLQSTDGTELEVLNGNTISIHNAVLDHVAGINMYGDINMRAHNILCDGVNDFFIRNFPNFFTISITKFSMNNTLDMLTHNIAGVLGLATATVTATGAITAASVAATGAVSGVSVRTASIGNAGSAVGFTDNVAMATHNITGIGTLGVGGSATVTGTLTMGNNIVMAGHDITGLPATSNIIQAGGNSPAASITIGTTTNFNFVIEANGSPFITLNASGNTIDSLKAINCQGISTNGPLAMTNHAISNATSINFNAGGTLANVTSPVATPVVANRSFTMTINGTTITIPCV